MKPGMMVVFAERARQDIRGIYDSIVNHDRAAAQRVENAIRAECERLGLFPFASVATDEPNVRRVPLVRYKYSIYCRVNEDRGIVEIVRVIHAARIENLDEVPGNDK